MENASKALIIAGGVLLAIIVIGLIVILWTNTGAFNSSVEDAKKVEQIVAFNKAFESYQKTLLRGNDVASVINKVRSNNITYSDNPEYKIEWELRFNDNLAGLKKNTTYSEANKADYDKMLQNSNNFKAFKNLYFKCTSIQYSTETGRVNKIIFEEYKQEQTNKWLNEITV